MKLRAIPLLSLVLLLPATLISRAAEPESELAKAPYFAFGGVGFAGTISEGEVAYKKTLACDDAEERFVKIFEKGTPHAKAYALHGLHALKSEHYPVLKKRFLKQAPEVKRMSGCILGKDSAEQIVAFIEKRGRVKAGGDRR